MKKVIAYYTKFGVHIIVKDPFNLESDMEIGIPMESESIQTIKESSSEIANEIASQFGITDIDVSYNRKEERAIENFKHEQKIYESQADNFMFDMMPLSEECVKPFSLN